MKHSIISKPNNKILEKILSFSILIVILILIINNIIKFNCLDSLNKTSLCTINYEQVALIILSLLIIVCLFCKTIYTKYTKKFPVTFSISLLLALFSFFLAIKYDYIIGDIQNEGIHTLNFIYNVIGILSVSLSTVLLFKSNFANYIRNKSQTETNRFIRKVAGNNEYFIVVIIILILTPIFLTFLVNDLFVQKFHGSFLGISYTVVGIFITSLIYFKLKDKTTTLKEYLNTVIDILEFSSKGDTVYIIGPTLFVGHEYYRRLHNRYKHLLFEKIQSVNFVIANLYFNTMIIEKIATKDIKGFLSIVREGRKLESNKIPKEQEKIMNDRRIAIEEFKKVISPKEYDAALFHFHDIYFPLQIEGHDQYTLEINTEHHLELIFFYKDLLDHISKKKDVDTKTETEKTPKAEKVQESNPVEPNTDLKFLNWFYFNKPLFTNTYIKLPKNKIGKKELERARLFNNRSPSNFFAVANISRGHYYIGQYKILNERNHEFHGTSFVNKNISAQMEKLLKEFIEEYHVI